jgi:hypothetical protein
VDEWGWHEVLYALWCLGDLERVDDLEQRVRRVSELSMTPITPGGARNLNAEREAVLREIRRPVRALVEPDLAQFLDWPGMPNYRKPVS